MNLELRLNMHYDKYGNELEWKPLINDNKSIPMYQRLVYAIAKDIDNGILMRGYKLPPQRVLANHLGINHGTVTRAYKICEEKGLVKGVVGRGTYIAASPGLPISMMTDHQDSQIISLGMSVPLYECNKLIEKNIRALEDKIDYNMILKYCPPEGHIKHRYVATNWLQKNYKILSHPDQILITSGTQNALSIILMTLFKKGDRIIVDEYTYTGIKSLASYLNIILVPVKGNLDGMDINELKLVCKREQPKGVYMISDYQNPLSITLSEKKRKDIASTIESYNMLLIEDGTFSFSVKEKIKPISVYIPNNSFYISGTSKAISPSFRISYIVAPLKYKNQLQHGLNNIIWMASPYTSEIISLLQSTGTYEMITSEKTKILEKRNQVFDSIFKEYDVISASTACYRFLTLPSMYNDVELEYKALKQNVQIFSANRFYVGEKPPKCTLRLSVSSPNNIVDMRKGLEVVKSIIQNGCMK
jgi:DNA-binding transcriptional MocR family regulator